MMIALWKPAGGAAVGVLAIALGGCAGGPTWPGTEHRAAEAAGVGEPIEVRVEGGEIDARPEIGGVLTMGEAVSRAVREDADVQAALAGVRIALVESQGARLLPNPLLSVAVRFPESGVQPIIDAGLTADLISILRMPGRIDAADARLRAAGAEALSTVLDTAAEAQRTFVTVAAFEAGVPLMERRRELIAQLKDLATRRLEAGEGGRLEVVALEAEHASIEADLHALLLDLHDRRLELAARLGRPNDAVGWRVEEWREPSYRSVSERPWIEAALGHRPEIERIEWELAALGVELDSARWAWLEGGDGGGDGEREEGEWSVGPAASIPLPVFDFGQAARDRAEAAVRRAGHQLTAERRRVVEQVRRASARFNESVHELGRATDVLLPLRREQRELAESAYLAGQTAVTEVIVADQALAETEERVVRLRLSASLAWIDLWRAVGGAVVEDELIRNVPEAVSDDDRPIDEAGGAVGAMKEIEP